MPRMIWKGAISFGLVHVPVGLYPASQDVGIDFDWLDKRSMDPVGYKRINKRTGKEIKGDDIVKGIKQPGGDYVVLSEDEIKAAYPKTTQTIEIASFVKQADISFMLLETPYYLEPIGKSGKVYALLREAMAKAGVIGIARVVIHTKEHLAVLIPSEPALILNTIRWASEIRPTGELALPAAGKSGVALTQAELKMASQLIGEMTAPWKPEAHAENFSAAIHALVARKVAAGQTETVAPLEEAAEQGAASNVVDLTELLARSLRGSQKSASAPKAAASKKSAPSAKKATARSSKPAAAAKTTGAKTAARKRA